MGRKRRHEKGLYRRGETWYADIVDRDGRRWQKSLRTADKAVARARRRKLELATTDSAPHETEALDASLTYYLTVTCASKPGATRSCYTEKARHVSRVLGKSLCDAVDREAAERYIAQRLTEGAAKHTVYKELVVLRGALKASAARDLFHGVVQAVVPKLKTDYDPRKTFLTEEQFARLLEHLVPPATGKRSDASLARREALRRRRALYVVAIAYLGPRKGEVEKFTPGAVDLARGVVQVPKGKTVSRPVPIHPVARPHLAALVRGEVELRAWPKACRDLAAACLRAGIPRVTPNDLRRTFGSWLAQAGVPLQVIADLMGNSVIMVARVYGRLTEDNYRDAISRLPGADRGVIPVPGTTV